MNSLITQKGTVVPEYVLDVNNIIDKLTVIYGRSGSGKTTIIKHIMHELLRYIEVCFIISPSEPQNQSYAGVVDPPMIHYTLSEELIEKIFAWQEMRVSLFRQTEHIPSLKNIYRFHPDETVTAKLSKISKTKADTLSKIDNEIDNKRIGSQYDSLSIKIYKSYLTINKSKFKDTVIYDKLTSKEKEILTYIDINPKMLLIFDDCAADAKPYFKRPVFVNLAYRGRHCMMTILYSCQDDTDLPTNIRKNARQSIFAKNVVAMANFERASNQFSKSIKETAKDVINTVFDQNMEHRKLVFGDDEEFYHFTAKEFPAFRFGSKILYTLCEKVSEGAEAMNINNPYYNNFKL